MLFHVSIPARDPERVARVIAELWGGEAMPFPPYPGGWMAWTRDGTNEIEVVPHDHELYPTPGEVTLRRTANVPTYSASHLALGMRCSMDEARAIAVREGWTARVCDRGEFFRCMELWVENAFLLELLPENEQRRYRDSMTPHNFRAVFGLASK